MRVAVPIWQERISPVFDAARRLTVFDIDDGAPRPRRELDIAGQGIGRTIGQLTDEGVDVLLCGAITRGWRDQLEAAGVRVVPFLTGPWTQLLEAFRTGRLNGDRHRMPGCGWGRRCRRRRRRDTSTREESS